MKNSRADLFQMANVGIGLEQLLWVMGGACGKEKLIPPLVLCGKRCVGRFLKASLFVIDVTIGDVSTQLISFLPPPQKIAATWFRRVEIIEALSIEKQLNADGPLNFVFNVRNKHATVWHRFTTNGEKMLAYLHNGNFAPNVAIGLNRMLFIIIPVAPMVCTSIAKNVGLLRVTLIQPLVLK
jgi:hypothetical protein